MRTPRVLVGVGINPNHFTRAALRSRDGTKNGHAPWRLVHSSNPGRWLVEGVEADQEAYEGDAKEDEQEGPPGIDPGFRVMRSAHAEFRLLLN